MNKIKQYQFWVCLVLCLGMFIGTYPFYHDMYIAQIHTFICICLNAFSAILFSSFLYLKWVNCLSANRKAILLSLTIIQAIGHSIFTIMNWGSFFFLPLSVIVFILLAVSYFKEKNK